MVVLYVVERGTGAFESARTAVNIVCAGDSLTGWNNFRTPDLGGSEMGPCRHFSGVAERV